MRLSTIALSILFSLLLISLLAPVTSIAVAQESTAKSSDDDEEDNNVDDDDKDDDEDDDEAEKLSITHGSVEIAGQEIHYTATAGKLLQKSDSGDEKAEIFFIAYTRDDADDPADRPISFCFNGGPGSSSVWLHLGMLGPKRVVMNDEAVPQPPPFHLVDNEYSLLDVTDIVLIDPVSTGYSRPAEGEEKDQFHGYQEDLRSVGQFIHDYTTQYERWSSPKFVLGESYGGLRSAGLAGVLQNRYRMYLNGIVLISAVVDFQTLASQGGNDLPYILFLPTYAATAWYHKALPEDLQELSLEEVVEDAERFARGPYARALLRGSSLPNNRREEIAGQMARLTGLSEEYVLQSNLRVNMRRYAKELLRDRRRTVGRYDSRFLGIDRDAAGEGYDYDPSGAAIDGPFTATMNDYLRRTLKFEDDRVYEVLTGNVWPWNYDRFTNRYVSASETLRAAMTANPYLKVFAACGYYDLATPQFAMQHTRNHLALAPELADNFQIGFYPGGHMMYIYLPSLEALRSDLVEFYDDAIPDAE